MSVAVIITTAEGDLVSFNAAAGSLPGWQKGEVELPGTGFLQKFCGIQSQEIIGRVNNNKPWQGILELQAGEEKAFRAIVHASQLAGSENSRHCILLSVTPFCESRPQPEESEEREARITSIYRAAPVGIGVIVDRRIQDVNDYFCRMVGFSKQQLIGRSARMFYLDEESFDHLGSELFPDFENGITKSIETRFRRNDGQTVHVLLSVTPLFENDRSRGLTFTVTDITDRKNAEKQLRLSQQTYAGIINSVREGIYIQDKHGHFLDMNEMALRIYGYQKEEIIGKTPEFLQAEGKNDMAAITRKFSQAYLGKSSILEFWGKRKDGSIFPSEVSLSPGNYFGERAVLVVTRDITERKKSEESLKESHRRMTNVMDSIDALITVVDMETYEVLFLNEHGQKEFGDVTGQVCWKALQNERDKPCDFCTNHLLINSDGTPNEPFLWEFQNTISGRWYDCRDQAIPWTDGRLVRLEVAIDITARKKAEEALRFELGFKEMVADVSSRFVNAGSENIDHLVNYALKLTGNFFGVDRSFIFLFSHDGLQMDNTHEWCAAGIEPQMENLQGLPVSMVPWWASRIRKHQHIHIPDVNALTEEAAAEKEILQGQGIRSVLVIPMVIEGQAIGFYGYDSVRKSKVWSDDQISLLKVLTEIISGGFGKQKARGALMESEMQLRRAQKIGHIGSWTYHLGTGKLRASDESHHIFGLNPRVSFTIDEVMQQVVEVNRQMLVQALANARSLTEAFESEFRILRKRDQELRDIFVVAEYDKDRNTIFGMIQDITERKKATVALRESEMLFRTLVENAFDGIYLMNDRRFVYINDRFSKIVEMAPEEITADGFDFNRILADSSKELVEKRYQDRKKGIVLPSAYEMQIISGTGQLKDVEISTVALNSGEKPHILGIMRDITYRKRNQNLEQEVAVAKKSAQFKQNFLANMSHEIRTPITGIIGMAEILSKTSLSDAQKEYLNTLKLSTENLREIINQILDYSKIEAGQMQIKNRVFATMSLLLNARKVFDSICNKQLSFFTDYDSRIPAFIDADEPRISQVINNFLSNAVKFTSRGSISIRIKLEEQVADQLMLIRVEVEDTGPGIPAQLQKQLFKPFAQLDQADQRVSDGTGLGLSISKELALMMGGQIGLESQAGEGSCFWFTFRARAMQIQQETAEKATTTEGSGKQIRILLVEDKFINQKVINLLLKSLGHEVVTANHGEHALEIYRPGNFDLILMDIQMPVMDGITATQKLKEKYAELPPVVGLSANAFDGDRERYMSQGMDDYLTKPVNGDDFIRLVDRLWKKE